MLTLGPMDPEHELINFFKLFSEFKPRAYFCINIYVLKTGIFHVTGLTVRKPKQQLQ